MINILLSVYINWTTTFQPYTLVCSLVSSVCYFANQRLQSAVLHWIGVALPLAVALHYYTT